MLIVLDAIVGCKSAEWCNLYSGIIQDITHDSLVPRLEEEEDKGSVSCSCSCMRLITTN